MMLGCSNALACTNSNEGDSFFSSLDRDGFPPPLLGDLGYPNLPLLITSHRDNNLSMLEALHNKKLCRDKEFVENTFGI